MQRATHLSNKNLNSQLRSLLAKDFQTMAAPHERVRTPTNQNAADPVVFVTVTEDPKVLHRSPTKNEDT